MAEGPFYYCLAHSTVEEREGCRSANRMGPYATREEAENWQGTVARRNEEWEEQDREERD